MTANLAQIFLVKTGKDLIKTKLWQRDHAERSDVIEYLSANDADKTADALENLRLGEQIATKAPTSDSETVV